MLDRLWHQERAPGFTGISLFTTVGVEISILLIAEALPGSGTNGLGGIALGVFLILVGSVVNAVAGIGAHWRREYWGGRIAGIGAAAWFATILVLLFW
jgi:hypothetical protein